MHLTIIAEIIRNNDSIIGGVLASSIYELQWNKNKLRIKSSLIANKEKEEDFKDEIRKVCVTNETCWILLSDGSVFEFDFIESKCSELKISEIIIDISCTYKCLYGISRHLQLYQLYPLQNLIHEFPKHQRIKKIVSGAEHCVLMTSNGDVFSFGCGLRGALGHGDVNTQEVPKLVEALAGLKIVDIATGSFHSVAVSSFGDVYCWGWNTNGQLGLLKVAQHTFENASESHQQVFTIPQLIELEDEDAIKHVFCGHKHTVLKTEKNRLLVAGLNNYGQLGLGSNADDVDMFTEVPFKDVNEKTKVVCGYWSTYLIN